MIAISQYFQGNIYIYILKTTSNNNEITFKIQKSFGIVKSTMKEFQEFRRQKIKQNLSFYRILTNPEERVLSKWYLKISAETF